MSKTCQCHRHCKHILRGSEALLDPEQMAALAPVIGIVLDAAYGFDADALTLDPECGRHGTRAISNDECICRGTRWSAVEFVQWLEVNLKAAGIRYTRPAGQPNRLRDGVLRMISTG